MVYYLLYSDRETRVHTVTVTVQLELERLGKNLKKVTVTQLKVRPRCRDNFQVFPS